MNSPYNAQWKKNNFFVTISICLPNTGGTGISHSIDMSQIYGEDKGEIFMRIYHFILVAMVLAMGAGSINGAAAESLVEPNYDGDSPKIVTPWIVKYDRAARQADMDYIRGMRPHHAGALPMSRAYLSSPDKSSARLQALAKGIIHNQSFEIMMLDTVSYHIQDIDFGEDGQGWYQVATKDIAMHRRFIRLPMPAIHPLFGADEHVSAADVRFAKAMIVHHEGALMMAQHYLDNPDVNNGYLERMNLDVLRDQAQEIALMWNIVENYDGNHCDIKITPDMIEGMDDMMGMMDFSQVNCTKKPCCCDGHKNMGAHKKAGMKKKDCCCRSGAKHAHKKGAKEQCPVDMGTEKPKAHKTHHHKKHHHKM